ncbi:SCO family protein [Halovivax cerinus]|uniref:SCO family protein n=1 Tax=Halovivax cerinus TaxID=1487865 RepID=A0ABD5NR23_9EURY|nr:SCO family protein [Halovivax cerinus]
MKRRSYLGAAGLGGLSGLAGCLDDAGSLTDGGTAGSGSGSGGSGSDDPGSGLEQAEGAVLGPPDLDLSASSHPTYGDRVPSYTFTDPFADVRVSDTDFQGERAQLYTFYYTNCPDGVCPALLQQLVTVNLTIRDEELEDGAAFVPVTFDPGRDDRGAIAAQADDFGVDPAAADWYFLRPESWSAVEETLVAEDGGFGLPLTPNLGDGGHGGNESDGWEDGEPTGDDYVFPHFAFILLVNENGIVERAYPNATTTEPSRIEEDMLAVLEG